MLACPGSPAEPAPSVAEGDDNLINGYILFIRHSIVKFCSKAAKVVFSFVA
jgi:hypothetical protein